VTTTLTTVAQEEGTYIITAAFTDEGDSAVTPNVITWTLTDRDGDVINSREDVSVDTPASSIDIVLSGDDLAIGTNGISRVLLVEATYDSDAGSDLPLKGQVRFNIDDYVAVT